VRGFISDLLEIDGCSLILRFVNENFGFFELANLLKVQTFQEQPACLAFFPVFTCNQSFCFI